MFAEFRLELKNPCYPEFYKPTTSIIPFPDKYATPHFAHYV